MKISQYTNKILLLILIGLPFNIFANDLKEKPLIKSCNNGILNDCVALGDLYKNNTSIEQNFKKAISWYKKAADKDNTIAQYNLGLMYNNGTGVERDDKQAIHWFTKSANLGNTNAQNTLGGMYYHGRGVEKNLKQTVYWFQKSAEQGDIKSQYNLGLLHAKGLGVEKDNKQAIYWYGKAANQGYANAQFNLAMLYLNSGGLKDDTKKAKAIQLLEKASNQGHPHAKNVLIAVDKKHREKLNFKKVDPSALQKSATPLFNNTMTKFGRVSIRKTALDPKILTYDVYANEQFPMKNQNSQELHFNWFETQKSLRQYCDNYKVINISSADEADAIRYFVHCN